MAMAIGGRSRVLRVTLPLLLSSFGGLLAAWFWIPTAT